MTKLEWYNNYRQVRTDARKNIHLVSIDTLTNVIKELYGYIYTPEQEVFIRLVDRYKDKLNQTYFDKIESWKSEARQRSKELMQNLIYYKNPMLDLIKKDDVCDYIYGVINFGDKK